MAKTIDQISVFVENKAGSLVDITRILGEANIDIRAMSLADTADFGVLRMIVDRPDDAVLALRGNYCIVNVTKVIAVPIPDSPGSLSKVLTLLADHDLFIEYSYAFITRKSDNAYVIFRLEDNDKAAKVLMDNGIVPASAEELYLI